MSLNSGAGIGHLYSLDGTARFGCFSTEILATFINGGASCPVMGAVFKTVSGCVRAYPGGFDSHTPPPYRFWISDFRFWISRRKWMTENEFKQRTKDIALRVIRLVDSLPNAWSAEIIGKQLLRSGTSIGANYRAACRGKSTADVIHKLTIVEEEADETLY